MAVEVAEKFCPICGREVTNGEFKRFGEYCCSEEHAEEYVKEVRGRRQAGQGMVASAAASPISQGPPRPEAPGPWWRRKGCC